MSEPEIIGPDEAFEEPRQGMGLAGKLFAGAAITVGVVALAGAVWFAYQQGIRSGAESAAPVIKADSEPVKRKPEEPGGLEVPHQDKLVFSRLAPGQTEEPLERLLPPPEEPVERQAAATPPEPAVEATEPAAEATEQATVKKPEAQEAAPEEPAPRTETANAPPSPPSPSGPAKPLLAVETPATPPASRPAAEPAADTRIAAATPPESAPAPKPAADAWRIQLAAVSSRERALTEWDRLKSRNTDLLGPLSLNVETAKLSRGTFYRIQAGPLDDRASARSLCGQLRSRNQDCLVVAP